MQEEQVEEVLLGERLGGIGVEQATRYRGGAHLGGVDPASVVGDCEDDVGGHGFGADDQLPLPLLASFTRLFDPVVDGVANEVQERLAEPIEHGALELRVAAPHADAQALALGVREVSRIADELGQHGLHRNEAQSPRARRDVLEARLASVEVGEHRLELAARIRRRVAHVRPESEVERAELSVEGQHPIGQFVDSARIDLNPVLRGRRLRAARRNGRSARRRRLASAR